MSGSPRATPTHAEVRDNLTRFARWDASGRNREEARPDEVTLL